MSDKKKINKISLILHTIPIWVLVYFDETLAPSWFEDYINPEEALSIQENVILSMCLIPLFFLLGLWFKSLFNTIIPKIFNFREISYWEAYGLLLIMMFIGL